jgi:hypothetical protein
MAGPVWLGERALQQSVTRRLRGAALVLDFQHVLAKLWSAVYAFLEEGCPKAVAWVQERAWRLLHGEVSQVVHGMTDGHGGSSQGRAGIWCRTAWHGR